MSVYKVTLLFQHLSNASSPNAPTHRTGGWSESWYLTQNNVQGVIQQLFASGQSTTSDGGGAFSATGFLGARASLLGIGSSISGVRIQQVSPIGPSQSIAVNMAGTFGSMADIPQMALLCKAPGLGVNNIRRFTLRGLPDSAVVEGELANASGAGQNALNFFRALQGFQFRARDLSQQKFPLLNISATGLASFQGPVTFAVFSNLRILKTKDAGGRLRGGVFNIASAPGPVNQVQLANWPYGLTTGGNGRLDGVVFPGVDYLNTTISRVVTRRVGRPSGQYRGRRSARH